MKTLIQFCAIALMLALVVSGKAATLYSYTNNFDIYGYDSNNFGAVITRYSGPAGNLLIPAYFNGVPVIGIGEPGSASFGGNQNLTSVVIPDTVVEIGMDSSEFENCQNLTNVFLGNGVTYIGQNAFSSCLRLGSIVIPNSVVTVDSGAFYNCSSLSNVTFGTNLANIGQQAFQFCSVTNIMIPGSVTNIGDDAFFDCAKLASVMIGNDATNIAQSIGESTFEGCSALAKISLGTSVKNIGTLAFRFCSSLTTVIIPASVTNIGSQAFYHCGTNLGAVFFLGNALPDSGDAFLGDSKVIVYYLPGSTGWGLTYGSAPTMLWNPHAQSLSVAGGQFGFNIAGPTNATIVVVACTNLSNPIWLPVSTNILTGGTSPFGDPQSANYSQRYYRFRSP